MRFAFSLLLLLLPESLWCGTLYVSLDSTNPVSPYTNWTTAATNIQQAIDVSTNGVTHTAGTLVSWQSVSNRSYYLQRSTNIAASAPFAIIQSNLPGQTGVSTYLDTTATNPGPFLYRIGVR